MSTRPAAIFLLLLATALIGAPALVAFYRLIAAPSTPLAADLPTFFSLSALLTSLLWAALISAGAVLLAWPGAWLLRTRGYTLAPLLFAPLLLPNYLAFGAFNLLRAPGTTLGDLAERLGRESPWIPVALGKAIAVGSIMIWSAPVAMLILALHLRRIDDSTLEQLALDAGPQSDGAHNDGFVRTKWTQFLGELSLARDGLRGSFLLVLALTLGSVIPLHVARVNTLTIRVWLAMDLLPQDQQWRAWILTLPLIAIALVAAFLGVRGIRLDAPESQTRLSPRVASRGVWFGALAVAALGAIVPGALLALHLAREGGLVEFIRNYREPLLTSGGIALIVAAASAALMLLAWIGTLAGGVSKRLVQVSLALFAVGAIMPGVMLGLWIAHTVRTLVPALEDSTLVLVLAHLARFGVVPVALGCLLASIESRDARDQRTLDGVRSLGALWAAAITGNARALIGAAIIGGVLSLHEIEATVTLQPPGLDTLARAVLNQLHFMRTQEFSAAGLILLGIGLLGGAVCSAVLVKRER
jgi:ABC-type Fe3+ transport system permease subunit